MFENVNVERLQAVKQHILEEPKRLFMDHWLVRYDPTKDKKDNFPECGTIACIAGWTILLFYNPEFPEDQNGRSSLAAKLLGLTDEETEMVFYASTWPEPFNSLFHAADSQEEHVKVAADYIDHICEVSRESHS